MAVWFLFPWPLTRNDHSSWALHIISRALVAPLPPQAPHLLCSSKSIVIGKMATVESQRTDSPSQVPETPAVSPTDQSHNGSTVLEKSNANDTPADLTSDKQTDESKEVDFERGPRFWAIMLALAVTNILAALEGTVVSTALPTIIGALGGGNLYLWAVNGYFLPK